MLKGGQKRMKSFEQVLDVQKHPGFKLPDVENFHSIYLRRYK